jgi:hypothetical protein
MAKVFVPLLAALGLAAAAGALGRAGEAEKESAHRFKVVVVGKMENDFQGKKQKIDTDTEILYYWKRKGRERELSLQSLKIRSKTNGVEAMNMSMSRKLLMNTVAGKPPDLVLFDKAPDNVRKMLRDSFDTALCKVEVDAVGREVKRKVVAGPGARLILDQGVIANALLFHPPFLADKKEWQAHAEFPLGNDGHVKGKLKYTKAEGKKGKSVVKVAGTLTNDSFTATGRPITIKDARYKVKGEETYDPAEREWVSGKLTIDVSFQMLAGEKELGSAKGTIEATFTKLEGKKDKDADR